MNNGLIKPSKEDGPLLPVAAKYYLGALAVTALVALASLWLEWYWFLPVVYLGCGFMLNKKVLAKIHWHPIYNTMENIARAKGSAFLVWPFVYGILIIQLLIVRYL